MTKDYIHKEFPKTVGRTEFWKQIKRTVNGKEVSDEEISMIVEKVITSLSFSKKDHLLDLGCGNAALSSNFFPLINSYTGVDFSEYLLDIAREFFKPNDHVNYIESDVVSFVENSESNIYNKILMYGVMSYLKRDVFLDLLKLFMTKYQNAEIVFIGNIPNKNMAEEFYSNRNITDFDVDDHETPIGVWWDPGELKAESLKIGFRAEISFMPDMFYGSKYRFDLKLTRN